MAVHISKIMAHISNNQRVAAGITLAIALILITPLCGYLFQCGCTWPWSGLDSACNSYDSTALHRCPWCASLLAGWLSTALALLAGLAAATAYRPIFGAGKFVETTARILFGVAVFCVVAFVAAGISAKTQHYSLGIFAVNNEAKREAVGNH